MSRKLGNRGHVIYVDGFGVAHDALVTQDWSYGKEFEIAPGATPSINVVYVTADEDKRDNYGVQIQRETSVVHQVSQQAHGRYWKFADEVK